MSGVRAVSDNLAWAVGTSGVVLKTVNGGNTWRVCTPTLTTATNYGIDAFDSTTAWVTGTVGGSADVSIWKTTDGGATWVTQYNNPNGFGDALRFFNSSEGVYYGDPDPFPSSNWELMTTTNGGTNWVRLPQAYFPPADSAAQEWGSANSMDIVGNGVWFNSYYGATSSNPVNIYRSTNKGQNRTSHPIPFPSGGNYGVLAFSSVTNGAIGSVNGDPGFTTDAEATWTFTTMSGSQFRGMTTGGGQNLFIAVGSSGISYFSKNFGAWTALTTGTTQTLRSVDATPNVAWAVGNSGTILKLSGNPLPVEFTSFTANVVDRNVNLNWTTASELNNFGFEIQRKFTNSEYVTVAFVEGYGTTQEAQSYAFVDKNVDFGKYYYRLKQVDFGGVFYFSDEIEVDARIPNKFGLNQNYPNPFNPTTTINYEVAKEARVTLKVYDVIGNEVATFFNEVKQPLFMMLSLVRQI